ncbi:cell wall hydrolase [Bacillus suaedaesalsae]|uniref:Cell wall hydrolase n=1 Tax=Bacillus suaedaesalsae TaxID=2810349 RepID=A0ABS2DM67_9BACI|nr:cell wall hydrolase [Bacillus suaedaesalsae]MBM6619548.1 cell wall hydrolase [Bacillus suaedaesalsae]
MKKLMNILSIFTIGIGMVFPTTTNKIEAIDTNYTKTSIKMLVDLDVEQKGTAQYQFLTEDIENQDKIDMTTDEKQLLARLVHAEAEGEPYAGKVAVAEVVLNRVEHEQFPDTVKEVIYEKNAFEPVQNNSIQQPADQEAVEAVDEALQKEDKVNDALFFYNPKTAESDWIRDRKVIKKIGNHAFAI